MPRVPTGKRLRFQVFERDSFTCQYCGGQPPDIVLVADHITPVAAGGPTSIDNLITACEPCNQGKAARVLGGVPPRPDADLMYLAVAQEAAELHRYGVGLLRRDEALGNVVGHLQRKWMADSGLDWAPADKLVRQLIMKHGPEIAGDTLAEVSWKVATGYLGTNGWVSYMFTVARNMAELDAST